MPTPPSKVPPRREERSCLRNAGVPPALFSQLSALPLGSLGKSGGEPPHSTWAEHPHSKYLGGPAFEFSGGRSPRQRFRASSEHVKF